MDDDSLTREPIVRLLSSDGYAVTSPPSQGSLRFQSVLTHLDHQRIDLLLSNVGVGPPSSDGLSLVRRVKACLPELPAVVYTTSGSDREQAAALALGVTDYVVLRGQHSDALIVRNAVRTAQGGLWIGPATPTWRTAPDRVIAASVQMRDLQRKVHRMAADEVRVLIVGETGTGKELVARALHAGSARESRPFVAVNCGALATGVAEAEFFGSAKGAYTGSHGDRRGLLEDAAGGTLFLDELGELPAVLQPLLLRFLENGEFRRLGDSTDRRVDVRVIAATNRPLAADLAADRFRRDLLYRFRLLHVPPLRERLADLEAYVEHLCGTSLAGGGKSLDVTVDAMAVLRAHPWHGNLRELRSVLDGARALTVGCTIDGVLIERVLRELDPLRLPSTAMDGAGLAGGRHERERARLLNALDESDWKRGRTAASLGVTRFALRRLMQKHGIQE